MSAPPFAPPNPNRLDNAVLCEHENSSPLRAGPRADTASKVGRSFADFSVVIPARNEAEGLAVLLPELIEALPGAEIILSDDGSTDRSCDTARALGVNVVRRPYGAGNGAAITGSSRLQERETGFYAVRLDE